MTRATINTNIRSNLFDAGITFYSATDLNDSVQDAYDDVAFLTQCIIKKTTISFVSETNYYDFVALGVTDYLATTAIFNNNTNQWLRDDLSIRNFDQLRTDWELWNGQAQYWAPVNNKYTVLMPKLLSAAGTFDLYYWAAAPTISSDATTPLIATDMQVLLEYYSTGDLLEQAQEYIKAETWWIEYFKGISDYGERVKNLAKRDLSLGL